MPPGAVEFGFGLKTLYLIILVVGLAIAANIFSRDNSRDPEDEGPDFESPDPEKPEWPIVYRSYVLGEIQVLNNYLRSSGIETILEEVAPGTYGDGVAIKHDLRVHPDQVDEAEKVIEEWEERD